MTSALSLDGISIAFGGLKVLQSVSFEVPRGSIVSLIGPNGAGKTTVFNVVTGIYAPDQGTIRMEGREITRASPGTLARSGLTRTFQNIRLFKDLSVLSHAMIGSHAAFQYSFVGPLLRTPAYLAQESMQRKRCMEMLDLFGLASRADDVARNLSYGAQRKLEIVRALSAGARVLLLDEPAAGMNESETHELMGLIEKIRTMFGITILLIEHDMKLVMTISDRVVVLHHGVVISCGLPKEVRNDPKVIEAYLGAPA